MANISMAVILDMFFLIFSNAKKLFTKQKLIWRSYTPIKILSITKQVQIIEQKKFAIIVLNPDKETFVMHVAYLGLKDLDSLVAGQKSYYSN